jgi:exosome complex component RRP45
MDGRLANKRGLTVNGNIFIETTLASNLRIDGRNPVEYCKTRGKLLITIKFGRQVANYHQIWRQVAY